MRSFLKTVLRFFLTGVAALLPFVVTVLIVSWIVSLADAYIGPSSAFGRFIVAMAGTEQRYGYIGGYALVVLLIILLGFLVTRATVARFHRSIDAIFGGIPLVGKIYAAVGQAVALLRERDEAGLERFGGVVQIRIGEVKLVALLTSGKRYVTADGREHLLVFIPNSPVPATGFNVLVPVEDVHHLNIPIDDLAKLLMSLGVLGPQVLKELVKQNAVAETNNDQDIPRSAETKVR